MADIVNLRMARKARDRDERERVADANRLAHGACKQAKRNAVHERKNLAAYLDGHRLAGTDGDPSDR